MELVTIEEGIKELGVIEPAPSEFVTFEQGNGGTSNYEHLSNKPKINSIELLGNKTSNDLNLQDKMEALSNMDIENLLNNQGGIYG